MTDDKCRTCKHSFTTSKDRWYCKKSLADKYDCKSYETTVKTLAQGTKNDVLDKIRAEIEQRSYGIANDSVIRGMKYERAEILEIIDKYTT